MSVRFSRLSWLLVLGAGVISASAQQTIIYSKPAGVDPGKANSFMGGDRGLNANSYNAPRSILNVQPNLPLPAPAYRQWDNSSQADVDRRNNWTLLTPEQILGIKTPDEILGVKSKHDESGLSLEQKFLLRQRPTPGGANPAGNAAALFGRDGSNPFLNDGQNNQPAAGAILPNARQLNGNQPDSYNSLRRLFSPANAGSFSAGTVQNPNPNQPSIWASGFAQPPQPKVSPNQIANMEQFHAMLNNDSAPAAPAVRPVYSAPAFSSPDSGASSFFDQQPKINPAGRSFTALEDNSARPKGLTPLPGITGPAPKPDTKRPDWKAKLPPWLSEGP